MESYGKPKSSNRPTLLTGIVFFVCILLGYRLLVLVGESPSVYEKAIVVLHGDSGVTGTVTFNQASRNAQVKISGKVQGLSANSLHGFHVHMSGDLTNGCASAGPHFNPFGKNHGAPTASQRHVGDLGNIKADGSGESIFEMSDNLLSLNGPYSIIGRSVVVHAGTDDLGLGKDEESLKTGNAGARAACGIIGLA